LTTPAPPLELAIVAAAAKAIERLTLGADLCTGARLQAIVPAHAWQSAHSLGEWTLVSCTVAPGFDFSGFEIGARSVEARLTMP